jgi:PEGA domain-containing protein
MRMKQPSRLLTILLLVLGVTVQMACSTAPPANSNQPKANQQPVNANTPPANASANKSATGSNNSTTGSIEVTSVPPGARVLLIATDEDTASEPQQKGSTPTTITGVKPGKYTVDLEKPGYRFFQRSVKVSGGKTVKISAPLKKQ